MNFHGRTKGANYTYPLKSSAPNYKNLTGFVFTDDKRRGYLSMQKCLENQAKEKAILSAIRKDGSKEIPRTEFEVIFNQTLQTD